MRSVRTLFMVLAPLAAACGVAPPEATVGAGTPPQVVALATTAPVTVTSPGTLALSLTSPAQGTAGTPMVLTVVVQDTGPLAASGTLLNVTVSPGSQIGGRIPAGCVKTRNFLVSCAVGTLPSQGGYSLAITVTPDVPGPFFAGAFTSASFPDGTSDSNSAQAVIDVLPGATDLQITGFASTGSPPAGSIFNYTFQVKNNGPEYASGVTFADTLPASLALSNAFTTAPGGSCTATAGAISCQLGDLPVGGQASVVIYVVAPLTPAIIADTATVTSPWGDPKPANDATTVTVQVK